MKISNNKFEKIILTELFHKHQRSRYLVNINPKYEKVIQLFKKKMNLNYYNIHMNYLLKTGLKDE